MIFVNFKTYEESTGEAGLSLLDILGEASSNARVPIIPVVSALDASFYTGKTLLPLWVQHLDPVTYGAHTGSILPERLVSLAVKGTFLNHSEHRIDIDTIEKSIARAHEVGLKTLVFSKDITELKSVLLLKPDFVSYEPPELVGSTTTSVSEAKPEVISEASTLCKDASIPLIVGAGIHSTEDVKVAVERGALGVAVATDIVKSTNKQDSIKKLLEGFN